MNKRLFSIAAITITVAALLPPTGAQAQTQTATPEGRVYTLGAFDAIEISGSAVVRFTQGPTDQVLVEGDEDVQKAIDMEVRNGKLSLRSGGSWKFWNARRLQVSVTARELKRVMISGAADLTASEPVQAGNLSIDISGAGTARFDQLKAEQLSFHVSGAGDGRVAGAVKQLRVDISGKSNFDGANLMSGHARVSVSGIGDVSVWATQDLLVSVAGVGTVDYWGNPTVRRSVSGMGTLNDRGAKKAP